MVVDTNWGCFDGNDDEDESGMTLPLISLLALIIPSALLSAKSHTHTSRSVQWIFGNAHATGCEVRLREFPLGLTKPVGPFSVACPRPCYEEWCKQFVQSRARNLTWQRNRNGGWKWRAEQEERGRVALRWNCCLTDSVIVAIAGGQRERRNLICHRIAN